MQRIKLIQRPQPEIVYIFKALLSLFAGADALELPDHVSDLNVSTLSFPESSGPPILLSIQPFLGTKLGKKINRIIRK